MMLFGQTLFCQSSIPEPIPPKTITITVDQANQIIKTARDFELLKQKYAKATQIIERQDKIIEGLNIVKNTQAEQIENSQVIIKNYEDALRWYLRPSFTVPAAGLAGFVIGILIAK